MDACTVREVRSPGVRGDNGEYCKSLYHEICSAFLLSG